MSGPWSKGAVRQLVPIEFDSATPTSTGTHTYVVPDRVYEILVDGSAGGSGGGGGHTADPGGGGGGGAPGMAVEGARLIVVPGETLYISVGGGGLGGAAGSAGITGGETNIKRNSTNGPLLLRLVNSGTGQPGTVTNGGAGGNGTVANGGASGTGNGANGSDSTSNPLVNYAGAGAGAGGGPSSGGGKSGKPIAPHPPYVNGGGAVGTKGGGGSGAENVPNYIGYRLWGLSNPSTQGGKADVLGSGGVMGAGQDGVVYGTGGGGGAAMSPGGNGARGKLRLWV